MYNKKVEIPGVDTKNLTTLKNSEMIELFKKYKNGDITAKEKLVNGNLKLVLSILKRFKTTEDNINDMFQIGCVGLIKAIDNFDINVGVMFSTYAVPLILGEMKRANRDSNELHISRGIKDCAYKILSFKEKYFNLYGYEPSPEEISKELGIEEYVISYALNALKEPVSIYTPIYNDGGDTIYLLDQIANKKSEYDKDTLIALRKALIKLKDRERYILNSRYIYGKTQMELSDELGISQAQISRIEKTAIEQVKKLI
ncbi:MAG: sigma-70 family RNA polymerase sigma factor [Bacilli bacterium]|nr:sigma-70 family RNA polymerase sigma factor [Bacilli bacterium]